MDTVPRCFQRVYLFRQATRKPKYNDLKYYLFSGAEKDYLVSQILCQNPRLRSIDEFDDSGKIKATALMSNRYKINLSTVKNWVKNIKISQKHNQASGGRPLDLDAQAREEMKIILIDMEAAVKPLSQEACYKLMVQKKVETEKRKFLEPDRVANVTIHTVSMHSATCASTKKACYFRDRIPQGLTNARLQAMSCVRLIYITAVMVWALARFLPPPNKWNADCTTFICSVANTGKLVVVFRDKGAAHEQVTSHETGSELNLLIKYFLLGSAGGQLGDPVLIIAVGDNMEPDVVFAKQVVGVANNDCVTQTGWLYFCRTKCGNAAMWRHWFTCVCIPTIQRASDLFDLKDPSGERYRNFLSTDGEACILNEAFDPEILAMFDAANIDYLKLGPSATKVQQPADAADGFRDAKTGVAAVVKNGKVVQNILLRKNVSSCVDNLGLEFPSLKMSASFKHKILYSLEVITYVLRQSYMSGQKLAEGFVRVGQLTHVEFPLLPDVVTVDYDLMISKCLNQDITQEDLANMKDQLPIAAIRALRDGRLNCEFLDELEICRTPVATERDELTLCRQNSFIVTHANTILRHNEAHARRLAAIDPVILEQRKQQKDDARKILKEDAKIAKAAASMAEKAIESARVSLLAPQDKLIEKEASQAAKAAKRIEKELQLAVAAEESAARRIRNAASSCES